MPADPDGKDRTRSVGSSVAEETTRVESVRYLEGASGHAVLSLVFLAGAGTLYWLNVGGVAVLVGVVAYGVALNGLSIYLWDRLRILFETRFERDGESVARTLTPHRVSVEMKAELAAGAVLVGGFIVVLALAVEAFRVLGVQRTGVFAVVALALGDLGALAWTYARS